PGPERRCSGRRAADLPRCTDERRFCLRLPRQHGRWARRHELSVVAKTARREQINFQLNSRRSSMQEIKSKFCSVQAFLLALTIVLSFIVATPARAQFICGGSVTGAPPQASGGATAAGSTTNVACGTTANASGTV